jgi:hypothetical protein
MFYGYYTDEEINDRLSRVFRLRETDVNGAVLTEYSYNGTNRLVTADYQVPDVKLDLYQGTPGTYAGYNRFGRTIRQEWDKYNSGAGVRDRFDYTLDLAGNRLSRDIPSSLYGTDNLDQAYTYDGLQRLKGFDEGTLSGSSISGTPAQEEDWTLDQLGNWPGFVQKAAGSTTLNQTRYHNAVNEIAEPTPSLAE